MSYMDRICSMSTKNEKGETEFWRNTCYKKYVEKHGHHFSNKLARWASDRMKNVSGDKHTWMCAEVEQAFQKLNFVIPDGMTVGDAAYTANMAYADYFGRSLKTDADVLTHAYAILRDPDGYDGMVFNRFTADMMGMGVDVPWDEVI